MWDCFVTEDCASDLLCFPSPRAEKACGPEQIQAWCRVKPVHFEVFYRPAVENGDTGWACPGLRSLLRGVRESSEVGDQTGTEALRGGSHSTHGAVHERGTDTRKGPRDWIRGATAFATLTRKLSEEAELRPNAIRSSNSLHKIKVFHLQDIKSPLLWGLQSSLLCLKGAGVLGYAAI